MNTRHRPLTDEGIGYLVGFFFFIFMFFVIYNYFYNKKRKQMIGGYCRQYGLKYTETSDAILGCDEKFDMTTRGQNQSYDHIMSGTRGDYEFQILDFYYTVEKRNPRHGLTTYNEEVIETFCFLKKKGKALPHFYMVEKGMLESDVDFLPKIEGIKNIDFPLEDEFATLNVRSVNEDEIKKYFNKQRLDSLNNCFKDVPASDYDLIYEAKGDCLLVAKLAVLSVKDRLQMLETALKVFEAM